MFVEFRVELMSLDINYDDIIKKKNTSYWIPGVEMEGEKISNTGTKNIYYSEAVRMGSAQKKAISTPQPQEGVEAKKENKTIQLNHGWYQNNARGTTRCQVGITNTMPQRR